MLQRVKILGADLCAGGRGAAHHQRTVAGRRYHRLPARLLQMLDAESSVRGYLLKDAPSSKLAEALREVHRGGRSIAPELAGEVWREDPDQLTERERAVLRLAGEGLDSAEIGERLHLSAGTVRNYLSEAIGKLGASNRIEAYRLAQQKGWL